MKSSEVTDWHKGRHDVYTRVWWKRKYTRIATVLGLATRYSFGLRLGLIITYWELCSTRQVMGYFCILRHADLSDPDGQLKSKGATNHTLVQRVDTRTPSHDIAFLTTYRILFKPPRFDPVSAFAHKAEELWF